MSMEKTWLWYGPNDQVDLRNIRQSGATGVVTALHHIPVGHVWGIDEIVKRKKAIEEAGLKWSVVESIPVHEDIKKRSGRYMEYILNFQQSIRNLGSCGIDRICYNFMPVLDWSRVDLSFELPDGSRAPRFDATVFAAFDLFLLKRLGAFSCYSLKEKIRAANFLSTFNKGQIESLISILLAGTPGGKEQYTLDQFQNILETYWNIGSTDLHANLAFFLQEIIPTAEEAGVLMAIHPDDPPFPVFGLPRVISTEDDLRRVLSVRDSPHNGFCFCTGSCGIREGVDLEGMVNRLGNRINFIHLRSTRRDPYGNFYETDYLGEDVDMYKVIKAILEEQKRRKREGRGDYHLPMRPEHGNQMLDDLMKKINPGYWEMGRLRGLSELRGLELGIRKSFQFD